MKTNNISNKSKESTIKMCKIQKDDKELGIGFFCMIPFPDKLNFLPVLLTNNHILKEEDIQNGKKVKYIINNKIQKEIKIDTKRKTYTSQKYDTTIIELKPNKSDIKKYINVFEIDENKTDKELNELLKDEEINLVQYSGGNLKSSLKGKIKGIKEFELEYFCSNENNSLNEPIVLLKNNKVIAIHKKADNLNVGTLINFPINEFNQKYKNVNDDYKKSEQEETKDYITLIYNIKEYINEIKIFGDEFVENNKNTCKIEINEKEYDLCTRIDYKKFDVNSNDDKLFKIKLKGINNITDMGGMFDKCYSINSLDDISRLDTKNVTNMSYIFNGCNSLCSLPDISKWDTKKVNNMGGMFNGCNSLNTLPDISKWNTKNVTNIGFMFNGCNFLNSLPDISKWNTRNITDMGFIFSGCKHLNSLPDISKWDTMNVINMGDMFNECVSLKSLPDISIWNTKNVNNMGFMFNKCKSLSSLPDISKWDTSNVTNMGFMFAECISLKLLPDISKWDIKSIIKVGFIFSGCNSLNSLPDFSKWDTKNVTDIGDMLSGYKALNSLTNISK